MRDEALPDEGGISRGNLLRGSAVPVGGLVVAT